ncbi:50S ribosomal protein L30 [Lutimonas vermicola]|jgi:large subunit ribosomal protein L30|uniref:Large ribosomal subunit protein uL30 n=1 Tax=Lutimonas vermicola TaxID=414288 RepID=A0ABU9KZ78_9FLAO
MKRIRVKQVRSQIRRPKNQKLTLEALGLRKMNQVVEHDATPTILGMVKTVNHLISVEEIN